jgi:hypothetical protein
VLRFDTAKAWFEEITELSFGRQDGLITEFEKRLWFTLVDFATVYCETDVRFTFKNCKEITAYSKSK